MNEMTLYAPAKLNLYLDITGKREDGYHLLETVMTSVSLCDTVRIKTNADKNISVKCSEKDIPENEGNICHKAAGLFFEAAEISGGADIFIEKKIPHGAGMGGGSADAAAVFKGLNELYGKPLSTKELIETGLKAGADVPFCIVGGTKLCKGTGELISDCPALKDKSYLIVMPDFHCDTKAAYAKYDEDPIRPKNALDKFFGDFPNRLYNVFEEIYKSGEIEKIKRLMIENGAENASLTGSGAAVFGVFGSREKAERAEKAFSGLFTAITKAIP